ncbi:unnamed protein product [Durusdinium trenchii]|uniref:EF-hand domain-containing protein n=1 Tax=Durusdinium trenchii TaxID=1381693 RepID=A0ABP0M528_9DINO
MPRPCQERAELTAQQEWFLTLLDRKFAEQEAVIRELISSEGKETFNAETFLESNRLPDPSLKTEKAMEITEPNETKPRSTTRPRGTLAKVIGQEVIDPPLKAWVKGSLDGYMGMVVVVNLSLMVVVAQFVGARADYGLNLASEEPGMLLEDIFYVLDYVFFGIYVLDVLLRIVVLRKEWFLDHVDGIMYMNLFDAFLVVVHALELLLLPILLGANQEQSTSSIRVIKLVRIVRTLRIVKTVSLFRQLRLLVGTCVASIGALFWSMVLLFMCKVGFALIVCQALQGFIMDDNANLDTRLEMNNLYGSFTKSMYTTFEITHSGSWPARVRPVIEKVSVWYAIPFLTYITLVVFAAIRIVTALFIQETLANAANDADIQLENSRRLAQEYQDKLEELFQVADNDGSGSLTQEEFVEALSLPSIQRYLTSLDVRIQDCRPLFDILDDGDGHITIAEFCKGLMQLKGQARALDIHMLHRENSKVLKECQDIQRQMRLVCRAVMSA